MHSAACGESVRDTALAGLCSVAAAAGEGDGVGEERLGGEEFDFEPFRQAEALHGQLAFIGGKGDFEGVGIPISDDLGGMRRDTRE